MWDCTKPTPDPTSHLTEPRTLNLKPWYTGLSSRCQTPKKFYLTTPIYYVNARPHIGHAYSTIAADVIARRHRLLGDDTFFLTGTDEHGQKVQRTAEAAGIPPQQFADEVSATFQNLWKRMGITNDDYIRTTDPRHKRGVQHLWRDLEARGAIYLSSYTGQYCVSEETFVDGPPGTTAPTRQAHRDRHRRKLLLQALGRIRSKLIEPDRVAASSTSSRDRAQRGAELRRGGLKDLSISRTTFDWGIPVPANRRSTSSTSGSTRWPTTSPPSATAADDLTPSRSIAKFEQYWPADLHLVGKEITRFHCVYWPAFLMAAGLPLPKSVVANGWLLFEESKMSKSRGNVVRTETILDAFGDEVYAQAVPGEHESRARSLRRRRPPLLPAPRNPVRPGRQLQLRRPHHPLQRRPRQRLRQPRRAARSQ